VAGNGSSGRRPAILFGRTGWSLGFVFCLYAYQGLVAGFALTALPNHHAGLGASAAEVAWHAVVVGLPWVLQPAWGPVVDRFGDFRMGRRRFWAVAALAGSVLMLLLLLAAADIPGAIGRASPVLAAHSAFAALLDTAVDGMIIDRVPPAGLGRADVCTRAGFVSGIAAGAALFASVLPAHGLHAAAVLLAVAGVLAAVPAVLVREEATDAWLSLRRRPSPAQGARPAAPRRVLRRFLAPMLRRQALVLVAFCLAVEGAVAAVQLRTGLELIQERNWDPASLSRLQAALGLIGGTVGAFAVGWWSDRLGALRGLSAVLLLSAAAHAAVALLLVGGADAAAPLAAGMAAALPVLIFVALAPAVMRASRGPGAATRFALFMAALNLGGVGGSAVAGKVGVGLPLWAPVLAAACVFAGCALLARQPHLLFRHGASGAAPA
jgi:PAT family beta-lactamase induction signal transducer AmpG